MCVRVRVRVRVCVRVRECVCVSECVSECVCGGRRKVRVHLIVQNLCRVGSVTRVLVVQIIIYIYM